MGSLWRSKPMVPLRLVLQFECAHDVVDELGKASLMQFEDKNANVNAFQRNFTNEVKRADEMERKLRYFETQVAKMNFNQDELEDQAVRPLPLDENSSRLEFDELEGRFEEMERELMQLSGNAETLNRNYNELNEFKCVLQKDATFFVDMGAGSAAALDSDVLGRLEDDEEVATGYGMSRFGAGGLGYVTGVIAKDKMRTFERVLWRVVRGNLFMRQVDIEGKIVDPSTGLPVAKTVFIVFYQGERAKAKITKISESFGANLYPCSENAQQRMELLDQVETRLRDLSHLLQRSDEHLRSTLLGVAVNIANWRTRVVKEKAIFSTLNMFQYDVKQRCLYADGWCCEEDQEKVQEALQRAKARTGANAVATPIREPRGTPPTFFRTNKYVASFQGIVDSYGIARYREVNPGTFTIVTFPFIFGVMFGDVGHGFLLALLSLLIIIFERSIGGPGKKMDEMMAMIFNGRYLLFLMGVHALYCGAVYNEWFALPANIFGSRWQMYSSDYSKAEPFCPLPAGQTCTSSQLVHPRDVCQSLFNQDGNGETNPQFEDLCNQFCWNRDHSYAYPFGVDPVWKGAPNELNFYNSLKMKMSVIIGVTQMLVGIMLHLFNSIYTRNWINAIFEWLPEVTFMTCSFGYMCVMIIYKWNVDFTSGARGCGMHWGAYDGEYRECWENNDVYQGVSINMTNPSTFPPAYLPPCSGPGYEFEHVRKCMGGTSLAPGLINTMIQMFLGLYKVSVYEPSQGTSQKNAVNDLYDLPAAQLGVQLVLILLMVVSVPLLLLPKPIILLIQHKMSKKKHTYEELNHDSALIGTSSDEEEGGAGSAEHFSVQADGSHNSENGGSVRKSGGAKGAKSGGAAAASDGHGGGGGHDGHGEFEFGEVFVHQIIHTIEFVLGCVSNTASYLRLWALSLAHSELAAVFLDRVLFNSYLWNSWPGIPYVGFVLGGVGVFLGFAGWAAVTIAVLLIMESLSAFLHALRLHWVEFQNKFFAGDGYKFKPFSYHTIFNPEDE